MPFAGSGLGKHPPDFDTAYQGKKKLTKMDLIFGNSFKKDTKQVLGGLKM